MNPALFGIIAIIIPHPPPLLPIIIGPPHPSIIVIVPICAFHRLSNERANIHPASMSAPPITAIIAEGAIPPLVFETLSNWYRSSSCTSLLVAGKDR
jgi:hypothetical protein